MLTAYIGMGGNLPSTAGSPEATLAAAAERLGTLGRVVRRSSLYSTEPVGYSDQPRFLNAVVALETNLSARELLKGLLRIEKEFGRDRSAGIQNGPRTLDLDLLLFGSQVIHEAGLVVPHPRLAERAFVLVPLNEIAPDAVDPVHRVTVKQLLTKLRNGIPAETNAILSIQTDLWRSICGVSAGDSVRPDADEDHTNS